MVSTVITVIVLVGLFLLGIKFAIDLIRERPHKKPLSSYYERQRSVRDSTNNKAA
jgi:hypothetical protein